MTLKRQTALHHGKGGMCGGEGGWAGGVGGLFIHRPHIKNSAHQTSSGLEEMTFLSVLPPKSPEGFGRTLAVRVPGFGLQTCKALYFGFTEAPSWSSAAEGCCFPSGSRTEKLSHCHCSGLRLVHVRTQSLENG